MKLPILSAMVVAERVYRDRDTGKFLIIGTFGKLRIRASKATEVAEENLSTDSEIVGPALVVSSNDIGNDGTPSLYLALTDIRVATPLRLRYQNLMDGTVLFEGRLTIDCDDPLTLVEVSYKLPSLAGPSGSYSLDLLCNGHLLGQWRITVEHAGGTK